MSGESSERILFYDDDDLSEADDDWPAWFWWAEWSS